MTLEDVVMKLVGEVMPVGDSAIDWKREENLDTMIQLTTALLDKINKVGELKDSPYASIARAGHKASSFLIDVGEQYF